jgi:hypothetical protein
MMQATIPEENDSIQEINPEAMVKTGGRVLQKGFMSLSQ